MKRILIAGLLLAQLCVYAQRGPQRGQGQHAFPQPRHAPQAASGDEQLLQALLANSPFGGQTASVAEKLGVSLRSAAFVDGRWRFSVVNKDGRTVWLGINEENEVFPCKITAFDRGRMSVKVLVNGRIHELSLNDRASFARREVQLSDGVIPSGPPRPRSPEEKKKLWAHATDQQKLEANKIVDTAKSEGRRLSRKEFRRLREIEDSIKVPETPAKPQGK